MMTIKYQSEYSKAWVKATLLKIIGEKYLILCGDRELLVDPERVVLS